MTVGIAIKCVDGIVVASDSLATFGRGVAVSKFVEKIHVIEHPSLLFPVVIVGSGATAFVDKFQDRCVRQLIPDAVGKIAASSKVDPRRIRFDIVDFAEMVCEPLVMGLFKDYVIDRMKFFGGPAYANNYSLGIIVAGATRDGDYRAFFVHGDGLTENIPDFGTIGSGAAYAELFLHQLSRAKNGIKVDEAASFAIYAVKGAELMDPNVGGTANVKILRLKESQEGDETKKELVITSFPDLDDMDGRAHRRVREILEDMGDKMRSLVKDEEKVIAAEGVERSSENNQPKKVSKKPKKTEKPS